MCYSKKAKEKKVKELLKDKEFISYAQSQYESYKKNSCCDKYNTFEAYLTDRVFYLDEEYTIFKFIKKSNKKTINNAMDTALADIEKDIFL